VLREEIEIKEGTLGPGCYRRRRNHARTAAVVESSGEEFLRSRGDFERAFSGGKRVIEGDTRGAFYRCEGSPYDEIHGEFSAVINGCSCMYVSRIRSTN
jgi:hypothetical protein